MMNVHLWKEIYVLGKKDNKPNLTTLNEILLSAEEQVTKYMNVISHGQAQRI
jgi:hypothetical protein